MQTIDQTLPRSVYEKYPFDAGNCEAAWLKDYGPIQLFEGLNDNWGWSSIESLEVALGEFEKLGFRVTLREVGETQTAEIDDGT